MNRKQRAISELRGLRTVDQAIVEASRGWRYLRFRNLKWRVTENLWAESYAVWWYGSYVKLVGHGYNRLYRVIFESDGYHTWVETVIRVKRNNRGFLKLLRRLRGK